MDMPNNVVFAVGVVLYPPSGCCIAINSMDRASHDGGTPSLRRSR